MSHYYSTVRYLLVAPLLCFAWQAAGLEALQAAAPTIANPDFAQWQDGLPVGWNIDIGAQNGADSPRSEVKRIVGPALMLRGDAATKAWCVVSQSIDAAPRGQYTLRFLSRTKDIAREGPQFDNCYVAVTFFDATGNLIDKHVQDVSADEA
ncbi:MAG: hypothetical protein KDA61_06080, partial [Planctomycetales bacterium]|nr:hypothetical protein [Planctomycetales bacterium]